MLRYSGSTVSNTSSVTSVYGEFSMSIHAKNPCCRAGSRIRRMLSTQVAVDRQPQLRQLHRDVALDVGGDDVVHQAHTSARVAAVA